MSHASIHFKRRYRQFELKSRARHEQSVKPPNSSCPILGVEPSDVVQVELECVDIQLQITEGLVLVNHDVELVFSI